VVDVHDALGGTARFGVATCACFSLAGQDKYRIRLVGVSIAQLRWIQFAATMRLK
jgi:hypothetical protein